jgi:hypothetical protein
VTRSAALDWARRIVLGAPELPPWPPELPRARCKCGAAWFECGCEAVLALGEASQGGYVVVTPQPRARA